MASISIETQSRLAIFQLNAFIAQRGLEATQALVTDVRLHDGAMRDFEEAKTLLEEAEFEAYIELETQSRHEEYQAELEANEASARRWAEFTSTHTWQQFAAMQHPTGDAAKRAANLVRSYKEADNSCIFGYDCGSNPEGISQDQLYEDKEQARQLMMAALSVLTDDEAERVIQGNKDRDFDGSFFAVTDLAEVQTWREEMAHLTIAAASAA